MAQILSLSVLGNCVVTLEQFIMFLSGSSLLPKETITVKYSSQNPLPDPDCCFSTMLIPSQHDNYASFKRSMDGAISCQYKGTGHC